jgi:hypothetical protein
LREKLVIFGSEQDRTFLINGCPDRKWCENVNYCGDLSNDFFCAWAPNISSQSAHQNIEPFFICLSITKKKTLLELDSKTAIFFFSPQISLLIFFVIGTFMATLTEYEVLTSTKYYQCYKKWRQIHRLWTWRWMKLAR